jgi:antitoxin FitA
VLPQTRGHDIIDIMAQLIVRNIEDAVVDALRREAARHGRSAEAEHREILRRHLLKTARRSLKSHLLSMPQVGQDADFEIRRPRARRIDL